MNAYRLPTSINVSGVNYRIETDFRVILDILMAMSDPDLEDWEKQEVMYRILYPQCFEIPAESYTEACEKAVEFIDGNIPKGKPGPRTMDWEKDAPLIIPAVNKIAGKEIRAVEYMHWWTFMGFFMEIDGDGLFSQVLNVRQKKAKGKKLEKWEKEFERNNSELVKLPKIYSAEQKREMEQMEKWL